MKPINTTKTESYMDNQRYYSMRDAYQAMYEKAGEKHMVGVRPLRPAVVLPQRSVTKVNIEVNPQDEKIGDVEKAYYTHPAGFDPTNREDIAEPSKNKKVEYEEGYDTMMDHAKKKDKKYDPFAHDKKTKTGKYAVKKEEVTGEEFFNFMVENGITNNVESAEAIFEHMSDEWFESLYEGLKQARKNVGASTCWDGYKAKGTKNKGGKEVPNCVKEETLEEKRGLWDNIHAKRKRGGKPAKPGDKGYPKTLNVD